MKNAMIFSGCLLIALCSFSQQKPIKIVVIDGDTLNNVPPRHFTNALLKFDSLREAQSEILLLRDRIAIKETNLANKDDVIDQLMRVSEVDGQRILNYEGIITEDSLTIQKQANDLKKAKLGRWLIDAGAFLVGLVL